MVPILLHHGQSTAKGCLAPGTCPWTAGCCARAAEWQRPQHYPRIGPLSLLAEVGGPSRHKFAASTSSSVLLPDEPGGEHRRVKTQQPAPHGPPIEPQTGKQVLRCWWQPFSPASPLSPAYKGLRRACPGLRRGCCVSTVRGTAPGPA